MYDMPNVDFLIHLNLLATPKSVYRNAVDVGESNAAPDLVDHPLTAVNGLAPFILLHTRVSF
jgi:hypothetical protein